MVKGKRKREQSETSDQYDLHTDGFTIHKSIFSIDKELLDEMKSQAKRCNVIFNHNKKHKKNDRKRSQIEYNPRNKPSAQFLSELYEFYEDRYSSLIPNDTVIIKSLPGCQRQMPHTDYEPTGELALVSDDKMPLGSIVSLMPSTPIYVWPKSIRLNTDLDRANRIRPIKPVRLLIEPGDILVFRGDLVHAGADFDKYNYRIHTYLDSECVNRIHNRTWLADKIKCIH